MQRTTKTDGQAFKPSAKQIYCLLHLTVDLLGLDWPADRRAASEMIQRLSEHTRAEAATEAAF